MRDEFLVYYRSLNLSQVVMDRINNFYDTFSIICPEEITGTFVTDFIKEDGARDFQNLWFFSQNFIMEADAFLSEQNIDIVPSTKISRIQFEYRDFNFISSTDDSRLNIDFILSERVSGHFKSTKQNCDILLNIYNCYLRQGLV